jgi:RNA polymerase sigma-70 factor (ECF subfamily)
MEDLGNIEDYSLVRAAQSGNHAAFEQLVHAYEQAVLRLALRITRSESDAQDIHQEAFLKAYNKLGSFRFECSFSTWIYRIVTNACFDHLRRDRSRTKNFATEVDVGLVAGDSRVSNPEQQLLLHELGTHIVRALRRLTPRERMVFELKYFEGLKLRAISEIIHGSEASVKTSLFRATQKLHGQLARYTKGSPASFKQHSQPFNSIDSSQSLQPGCGKKRELLMEAAPRSGLTPPETASHFASPPPSFGGCTMRVGEVDSSASG